MPDIDSLSIQITSSTQGATRSIDALIQKLTVLNGALNNYTEGSVYVKGLESLAGGLKGISSAVNSIDIEKLKNLSTVLNTLAGAGEKLSKLNFAKDFSQMGSELQKVNSAAANTTKRIADTFSIPTKYRGDINEAVKKLYNSGGNETAFKKASADIREMVKEAQNSKRELSDVYKNVRGYINKTKIYIPESVMQNWGDEAISNRGKISIPNTTTKLGEGTSLEVAAKEMRDTYGATIDLDHGLQACADSLIRFLDEERYIDEMPADFSALCDILGQLHDRLFGISSAFTTVTETAKVAKDEMLFNPGSTDIFDIQDEMAQAAQAVQNLGNTVQNVKAEMTYEIANPFEGLVKGLESLETLNIPSEKFAGVATLASTLGKFGGVNAERAVQVIPQVGRAFAEMATELSKAPAISDNLVRLAEALSKYSRSAQKATTSSTQFGHSSKILQNALRGMHVPTLRAHRGFTSLAAIFGRLYANFFLLIRAARMLGKAMDYSSSMTEAQNVVSVVFGKSSGVMDKFAQTAIKDFGLARLSAVQFASRFQAMGSTMGITADQIVKANDYIAEKISGNARAYKELGSSVADMSINLTKLTADIASLYNQDYEDVASDMQAIYTGMTRPLRKYGLDLTQATLKEWAMSQGLDSNIEKMSQAEKTMLRYQYVMSRAAGAMGDFAKTQDTWANSLRTVKQLLQEIARTIGEALINTLKPALLAFKKFLFNFLELAESALNALGKLLGWKEIDFGGASLVEDTEDYAEALDDAAGAAKKLKGQLRGIDELNNLTTNKGSGGGGGADSSLGAGIDSIWDQIQDTERLYESSVQDWYDFGRRISDAFKRGLSSIDWQKTFEKAINFGTNLAGFLNGLIDPETWRLFGETLGNGLQTAIKFAFAFGEEFDFENLGTAIADGINGFFDKFDGGELANALDAWVQGLQKMIKTAITRIDWPSILEDIAGFLSEIDLKTIDITIQGVGTIAGLALVSASVSSWFVANPIAIPVAGITFAAGLAAGKYLGEKIEAALGVNELTGESYWYEFWEDIFEDIDRTYTQVLGEHRQYDPLGDLTAKGGKSQGKKGIDRNIEKEQVSWFRLFLGEVADPENQIDYDEWFDMMHVDDLVHKWNEFMDELKDPTPVGMDYDVTWEDYYDFYFGWLDDAKAKVEEFASNPAFADITSTLANIASGIVAIGDPGNATGITDLGVSFLTLSDDEEKANSALDGLKEKFGLFKEDTAKILQEWWDNDVAPRFDLPTWTGLVSTIKESIKQVWEETVDFWSTEVPSWINEHVIPLFEYDTWLGYFSPVKDAFKQIWDDALGFAKGFWNSVADFVENFINNTIDGFGKLAQAKDFITGSASNFNVTHITIPRFANGGYPQVGSLFWAGEAGAEMVGTLNGKTAVASNNEITGITAAITNSADVEIQLLRQQNTLLQGILDKEFGISSDALFKSVRSSAKDFTNRTNKPAFY